MALRAEERRDKLRKAAVRSKYPLTRRYLNGETRLSKPQSSIRQYITYGGEPGELKHLSTRRKRKKHRCPKERRAKGKEPKPERVRSGVMDCKSESEARRKVLGKPARESESLVFESGRQRQYPEYHETRETLWEVGGTTPQG